MKKFPHGQRPYIAFVAVLLVVALVPLIFLPFSQPDPSLEKRVLSPLPQATEQGQLNVRFLPQLGDWFTDHFAFRQELVTANAAAYTSTLRQSNQSNVIVGKNGWLFYGSTVDDYRCHHPMSSRQAFNAACNLRLIQTQCEQQHQTFVFTIAPNKNSLYPQYMPARYQKSGTVKNLDLLLPQLAKQQVRYADLYKAFRRHKEILYHATDSHWNNKGALLAYNTILNTAGVSHRDGTDFSVRSQPNAHAGDLAVMLYPKAVQKEPEFVYAPPFTYTMKTGHTVEDLRIRTSCGTGSGSLVLYRDSFGNTLLPFFAQQFADATFSKGVPYDMTLPQKRHANVVVLELVERNLPNLQKQVPRMAAPECVFQSGVSPASNAVGGCRPLVQKRGGWVYVSGEVRTPGVVNADSPLYVRFTSGGKSRVYEASLQTAADGCAYGFALWLPPTSLPGTAGTAEVVGLKNAALVSLGTAAYTT